MDIGLDALHSPHVGTPLPDPQMEVDGFEFTGDEEIAAQIASLTDFAIKDLGKK